MAIRCDEPGTREALRGGWPHTGDVDRFDERGYLCECDRLKDMLIVANENVYAREIEDALAAHPAVAEAAVIGIPHELWGEEVLALVVRRTGVEATAHELIAHCRAMLARFKCPTKVEWRESLPRMPAGKLKKQELRETYWTGRERRV